jgi:hypothetical protein
MKPVELSGTKRRKMKKKKLLSLYRCMNEFKKGYLPRTNLVIDENDSVLEHFHIILNRWENYFCQLLM